MKIKNPGKLINSLIKNYILFLKTMLKTNLFNKTLKIIFKKTNYNNLGIKKNI